MTTINEIYIFFFTLLTNKLTFINFEALLGVNSDKRHGLETATREPRTGDERQTTPAKRGKRHQCQNRPTANFVFVNAVNLLYNKVNKRFNKTSSMSHKYVSFHRLKYINVIYDIN